MPLPNYVAQTDIFFTWLDAFNNTLSHIDNTSAYLLVSQNATPRISTGNVSLNGTATFDTVNVTSTISANLFSGNGASLVSLNASALATGTVPLARLTAANTTANGVVSTTTQTFAGNKTFDSDVTITGNLTIIGIETTLNVNNVIVTDSLIQLAANNLTSDALDIGLYGNYNGDGGAHEHTGLFRDASDGIWKLFVGLQDNPTTSINTSGTGYAVATLETYLISGGVAANSSGFAVTANSSYSGTLTVNTVTAATFTGNLTGTASNATNLNSQPGSYYTDASNLSTGTLAIARLDANVILTTSTTGINASALSTGTVPLARLTSANTTANGVVDTTTQTFAGDKTFTNNVTVTGATTLSNTLSVSGAVNALSTLGVASTLSAFGELSVTANANFNGGTFFVDTVSSRVGINNTAPGNLIDANGDATTGAAFRTTRYSTDTSGPVLNMRKARGTSSSPTAVANTDVMGLLNFIAYGGSNFRTITQIASAVTTYTSDTNLTSHISFGTTNAGTGASEKMRLSGSGNLGLGVAIGDSYAGAGTVFEIGAKGVGMLGNQVALTLPQNAYYDGRWIYATTNAASYYQQITGIHAWFVAGSGTINTNVSFTQAMTLVANGNVGIATATPAYKLEVNGSFAASTKSFVIPHPTKPNMKLRYGSLEGPENGVYVRGESTDAIIMLPDYWSVLVNPDSVTVTLTSIGSDQHLYVKSANTSHIVVGSSKWLGWTPHFYYLVHGARQDVPALEPEVPAN